MSETLFSRKTTTQKFEKFVTPPVAASLHKSDNSDNYDYSTGA